MIILQKRLKEHNSSFLEISDHPCEISIVGGFRGSDILLNVINNEPDIDKIYLYATDPYETKY